MPLWFRALRATDRRSHQTTRRPGRVLGQAPTVVAATARSAGTPTDPAGAAERIWLVHGEPNAHHLRRPRRSLCLQTMALLSIILGSAALRMWRPEPAHMRSQSRRAMDHEWQLLCRPMYLRANTDTERQIGRAHV